MKLISICLFFLSLNAFSKTVIMPSPFLEPLVEGRLNEESNWVKLPVSGEHMYGARRMDKPVIVELSPLTTIEDIEFKIYTGVINRGPYMSVLNASLVVGEKKFAFPVTATSFVGSYAKEELEIQFKLKEICEQKECNFDEGEYVYLYIDYEGVREIKPIYEWDTMFGAYYLFKYQR